LTLTSCKPNKESPALPSPQPSSRPNVEDTLLMLLLLLLPTLLLLLIDSCLSKAAQ
jgi:hypothetical protein